MANYNLTDNVEDSFGIEIRGLKYTMRYPRTEEVERIREISEQAQAVDGGNDAEVAAKANKELEDALYSFITPVGHEESIQEALSKENIKVMRNFIQMVRKELSLE